MTIHHDFRAKRIRAGQNHGELIAAESRHDVDLAHRRQHRARDAPKQRIPCGMAEAVVDLLEAIDVEIRHRERLAVASTPFDFALQIGEERTAVGHPRQRVRARERSFVGEPIAQSADQQRERQEHQQPTRTHTQAYISGGQWNLSSGIDAEMLPAWVLYWSQGFYATAVLFIVYVVIAVRGYLTWRADLAQLEMGPAARADV